MTTRRDLLIGAGAATAVGAGSKAVAASPAADARLNAVFDGVVERYFATYPEVATGLGLDKGARAGLKARLTDYSVKSRLADHAVCTDGLAKLAAIPDAQLSQDAKTSKAVIGYALQLGREARRFDFGTNSMFAAMNEAQSPHVLDQQNGALHNVPEFLDSQHRVDTTADAEAYVSRVHDFARALDAETERMRHDMGAGVVAPNFLLTNAIGQAKGFLATAPGKARLLESLEAKLKAAHLAPGAADRVRQGLEKAVYPAASRQLAALQGALAKSDDRAGVWRLKEGAAYYDWCLKVGTTTPMTPDQVHRLGLEQNKEIEGRMDALLKQQGMSKGTVGERMTALTNDPKNLFADSADGRRQLVDYLNRTIAATRSQMAKVSALSLKAPVLVRPVPTDIQDGAALGYMNPGAIDGSRPSIYYINLKSVGNWPKFTLPDLTYHETIPGHAWQGAYLTETGKLPLIRTVLAGFNAYVEGWALYSEQLADEIGLYQNDPLGRLGYLQGLKFRAVRLVVDTGLHSKRWSRNQAIEWAVQNSGRAREAMTSEIDRYCSWPGQACGYKVGHTEILRLREKAKAQLGPRFSLQGFDDAIVEAGPAPMTVLGQTLGRRLGFTA